MTERFANFQARLEGRPALPAATGVTEIPVTEPENEEDQTMADETPLAEREDYQAGHAAGMSAALARMTAVFGHEAAQGREATAMKMLCKPNMSAEDITDLLADYPAPTPAAEAPAAVADATEAAEAAARAEMRSAISETQNSDIVPTGGKSGGSAKAATDGVWDRANAAVGRVKKD